MIETPPAINNKQLSEAIILIENQEIAGLVNDINKKYLYWSEIKYKTLPSGITPEILWACVKSSRMLQRAFQWKKYGITVTITNEIQRLCHQFDMNFGGIWGVDSIIPNEHKEQYLISSLMEEAISSSQMEGAATTRKVAKEMLRKNLSPRSRSEQMIFNNYNSIRFIVDHKDEPLTSELLLRVHSLMTTKTLDNPRDAGRYRADNEVVVENSITHEVVHIPPDFHDIDGFIDDLCSFFNSDSSATFIHPIVKAIIIHFMVAYMHPFVDGNGRTARALFYWYMLKKGYWLTEYLSISRIIYKSKASYEKSFLSVEADDNDMSYFIAYNLRVIESAFKELKLYIERKNTQKQQAADFIRFGNINERQAMILSLVSNNPNIILTIKELQNRFAITHPTAKTDVDELVEKGFLDKISVNKVKSNYVKGEKFDELAKASGKKNYG